MYGWRARIGLLVPATNTVMETEFWRFATITSPGISIHTARIPTVEEVTFETLEAMEADSLEAAARVAQCRPDIIVFGCTSGTFLHGPDYNQRIEGALAERTGCRVLNTSTAFVEALRALAVTRADVVSPYIPATNAKLKAFLEATGFGVGQVRAFEMLNQYEHGAIEPAEIYRLSREASSLDTDGLFAACTQLRVSEVIDVLERDLGKPVVGAIQATWWATLRRLGIDAPIDGYGRLLREPGVAAEATRSRP